MSLFRFPLLLSLLLTLLLCSCGSGSAGKTDPAPVTEPAPAPAPAEKSATTEDFTFVPDERFGKITTSTKAADIPALYGNDAQPTDEIYLGEGMMTSGYLLYAGTKNRAEIMVPDEENGLENLVVQISLRGGDWRMAGTGVHVGTTLAELNELNGKPFELFGYDWDFGGTVTDWKGGKLNGLGVVTTYDNLKYVGDDADLSLMGDRTISSDDPALARIGVTVGEIVVALR